MNMISKFFILFYISLISSCIMIPDDYLQIKKYKKSNQKTIKIEGFNIGGYRTDSYTTSTSYGSGSLSDNYGYSLNESSINKNIKTNNVYIVTSKAEDFRGILAKTGCFRVVSRKETKADFIVVGQIEAGGDMSWHYPVQFLEGLTLTPLLGMPLPIRGSGTSSANIYKTNNKELLTNIRTQKIYLSAWTTLYSAKNDEKRGLEILYNMIMQDLADKIAQEFCNE